MLVQAPNPRGIDFKLQKFQTNLHTHLISKWVLDANAPDYTCYDRCYRNQNKNGFIPEVYTQNGDYKEVAVNDNVKVLSFFGMGPTVTYLTESNLNQSEVHLIFCANLKKVKATNSRPDEAIRQDVQDFLQHEYFGFLLNSIEIGIDNVFSEYSGLQIRYKDLQPFHCFRFNLAVTYPFNDHQCH